MSSHVSGVVALLKMGMSSPAVLGGISPVPVPPDAVMPYITCQEINGHEAENLESRSGLVLTLMQVNCWHGDYESAHVIRKLAKDILIDFSGSTSGLTVHSCIHSLDSELYDGTHKLHQLIARFQVWWES